MMTANGLERVLVPALGGAPKDVGSPVDSEVEVRRVEVEVRMVVDDSLSSSLAVEGLDDVEAAPLVVAGAAVVAEEVTGSAVTLDRTVNRSE